MRLMTRRSLALTTMVVLLSVTVFSQIQQAQAFPASGGVVNYAKNGQKVPGKEPNYGQWKSICSRDMTYIPASPASDLTLPILADMQAATQPSPAVQYGTSDVPSSTLVLSNNTLIPGNFLNPPNGVDLTGIVYDQANNYLYVTYGLAENVFVINASTYATVAVINIGPVSTGYQSFPLVITTWPILLDPANAMLYVVGPSNVSVVSTSTNSVIGTISIANSVPLTPVLDPSNGNIYIAYFNESTLLSYLAEINPATNSIIETISLGSNIPFQAAYDPSNGLIYFADFVNSSGVFDNNFTIVNTSAVNQVDSINISGPQSSVTYIPSSRVIYIGFANGTIGVFNTTSNQIISYIFASGTSDMIYDSSNNLVYTAGYLDNISVVNCSTNSFVNFVAVGNETYPETLALDPSNGRVYAADMYSVEISVIQTPGNVVITTIPLGDSTMPTSIAFDPANGYMYVTDSLANTISVVDTSTNTIVATIPSGVVFPNDIAFDPANGYLYVIGALSGNQVSLIAASNNKLVGNITFGNYYYPDAITYDPANTFMYVSYTFSANISALNSSTNKLQANITLKNILRVTTIAFDQSNNYICAVAYNINTGLSNLYEINTSTGSVVGNVSVGYNYLPAVAYDPASNDLYVTNGYPGNLTIVSGSTNKVLGNVTLHNGPADIAYDSTNDRVYVSGSTSNNVVVFNATSNSVSGTIAVGAYPVGLFAGGMNESLYVANMLSGTISIIQRQYKYDVTFTETGLPTGTQWYVNLSSDQSFSSTGTITFSEPNGTYGYTVSTPISGGTGVRYVTVSSGSVTVNGNNLAVSVPYVTQYYLTTYSSPSAGGTTSPLSGWYNASSTVTISATASSGYSFLSWTGTGTGNYTGTSASHTITMSAPITETAIFGELYAITFTEKALPSGTEWFVNLSNGQSFNSTTSTITFNEPNGTYAYGIATIDKSWSSNGGSFTVNGASVSQSIALTEVTYSVTLTETGLSSGTNWSVTLAGLTKYSTSTTITFNEPNGTYTYTVSNTSNYYTSSYSGTLRVSGAAQSESIAYQHYSYITGTVTPSNAVITINGNPVTVTSGSFTVAVTAGTYALAASSSGYTTYYSNFTLSAGQTHTLTISLHIRSSVSTSPSKSSSSSTYLYIGIGAAAVIALIAAAVIVSRKRKQT